MATHWRKRPELSKDEQRLLNEWFKQMDEDGWVWWKFSHLMYGEDYGEDAYKKHSLEWYNGFDGYREFKKSQGVILPDDYWKENTHQME
jgi:hypothetical protein